ncbi:MAG: hypothetical protein VXZ82_23675 [Planctomycetota bacterium]|nr:hypothetical protein [Planctomycetota bacterium]
MTPHFAGGITPNNAIARHIREEAVSFSVPILTFRKRYLADTCDSTSFQQNVVCSSFLGKNPKVQKDNRQTKTLV